MGGRERGTEGGRERESGGGGGGLALGAGLSPTQVINTLINSSAHIIIKTTKRKWWEWNILMKFTWLCTCSAEPDGGGKKVLEVTESLNRLTECAVFLSVSMGSGEYGQLWAVAIS